MRCTLLANSSRSLAKSIWLRSTINPSAWSSPAPCVRMASLTILCSSLSTSVTSARSRFSFELLPDSLDVVVAFGIDEDSRLPQQGLEPREYLPRHDLEPAFGLVGRAERIHGIAHSLDASRTPWPRSAVPGRSPRLACGSLSPQSPPRVPAPTLRWAPTIPRPPSPPSPSSFSPRAYCASAALRLLSIPL